MEKYKKKDSKRNKRNTYKSSNKSNFVYILFTIFLIIPNIYSVKFFRAYNLLSQELLLISDEGILLLNSESGEKTTIESFNNIITSEEDLQFVSFNQPSYLDQNIICRVKEYIFVYSPLDDYYLLKALTLTHISDKEVSVVPFKDKYENEFIFICYIDDSKQLNIEKYTAIDDNIDVSIMDITQAVEYDDGTTEFSKNDAISCQLMNLAEYENNVLICFIQSESNYLNGLVFDPDNDLSYLFLAPNKNINIEINFIKSAISPDKTNCLICYEGNSDIPTFQCIVFNIENKIWSEYYQFRDYTYNEHFFDINVDYIDEMNEYFIYFPNSYLEYSVIQLNNDFSIKNSNDEGNCFLKYQLEEFSVKYSFDFLYTNNKYIAIYSYKNNNRDNLITLTIEDFCNIQTNLKGFNLVNQSSSNLPETSERLPETSEKLPDTSKSLPSTSESLPDTSESLPDTSESVPDTSEILSDAPESLPSASGILPSSSESLSSTSERLPDTSEINISSSQIISSNILSTQIDIISSSLQESPKDSTLTELESASSILSTSLSFQLNPEEEKNDNKDKDKYLYNGDNLLCPENAPYENIISHKCVEECEPEDYFNRKCKINNNSTIVLEKTIDFIKNYHSDIKDRSLGLIGKSIGEGLEETAEELNTDLWKSLYELAGQFGYVS